MMDWLPLPVNFREELRAALNAPHVADRFDRLAALARYRLGFLETIQLDRALAGLSGGAISHLRRVRLAVLTSSTIDHVIPAIRVAGLRRRLLIDVHVGAYGQYRQELLDPGSAVARFEPQIVLFSLTAVEAIASVPLTATAAEAHEVMRGRVEELCRLWRRAREAFKATIIQQTFLDTTEPLFGSYDSLVPGTPRRLISRLNDSVSEAAAAEGVLLLDAAHASERDGRGIWFDTARWLHAKQEISPQAAPLYGDLVARVVAAQQGLSKKCLVLDLDNTLWGGVIGEDGLEGIVLGEGSAVGEAHLSVQRYAKQLKERGIILAVCSKNDPAIAESAFRDHPEMVLKRSDIAVFMANWQDKAANLKAIAARLNIGIDSLVFLDDNPAERARIRAALPMVEVPELAEDPAHYVRYLAGAGYFEAISFTTDDVQRSEQYAANAERQAILESSESVDDFLRNLRMSVAYGQFTSVDVARVTQLINKTNQFNPTGRRYSTEEVAALAVAPEGITLQFRLYDRLGDNGLVSALILRPSRQQPNVLDINTWVMSCRVFGRQLEFEAMNIAVEVARAKGVKAFHADYVPTKKNGVIGDLYQRLGFIAIGGEPRPDDSSCWLLDLATYVAHETRIARLEA